MIALRALSDSMLQALAAASLGLAAGLYLAGAPRLFTLVAAAPALALGGAIVTRPDRTLRHTG